MIGAAAYGGWSLLLLPLLSDMALLS